MRKADDDAQILLLTGILLALAFILFSVQLALVANIGQQAGRESRNPVLDDYLQIRRGLDATLRDEMHNETGVLVCPEDQPGFEGKVRAFMAMLTQHEQNRGHAFAGELLAADWSEPSQATIDLRLYLTDGETTIQDTPRFTVVYDVPC